jgi:hypothetical protein
MELNIKDKRKGKRELIGWYLTCVIEAKKMQ